MLTSRGWGKIVWGKYWDLLKIDLQFLILNQTQFKGNKLLILKDEVS